MRVQAFQSGWGNRGLLINLWVGHPTSPESLLLRFQKSADVGFRKSLFFLRRHVLRVALAVFVVVQTKVFKSQFVAMRSVIF
jgi:hypothetical protein